MTCAALQRDLFLHEKIQVQRRRFVGQEDILCGLRISDMRFGNSNLLNSLCPFYTEVECTRV